MVVLAKPKRLIASFREDAEIVALLEVGKKVKIKYELLKQELRMLSVSAHKKFKTPDDFESAIESMEKVQSFLNRIEEIRDDLLGARRILQDLYQTGSIHIGEFHHIQRVKTSSQRDNWVDEVLHPISSKIDKANELLELIEAKMWNLKHCYQVISSQVDAGKMIWYMRNPSAQLNAGLKR